MLRSGLALATALLITTSTPAQMKDLAPSRTACLDVVRYSGLVEAVKSAKGQVVLVDFWFDRCLPCKQGFPKLVGMQRRYDQAGLTTIAVNLDDPQDSAVRSRVESFLRDQQSPCQHLMLDEPTEDWQPKLKIESLPCVFLFDREGRLLHRWQGDEVDYSRIESRLHRALRE